MPTNSSALPFEQQAKLIESTVRAVAIAARYGPYRANCLKRSLVLANLLKRSGVDCELKLGAGFDENTFNAHAWVEFRGVVINDEVGVTQRFPAFKQNASRGN